MHERRNTTPMPMPVPVPNTTTTTNKTKTTTIKKTQKKHKGNGPVRRSVGRLHPVAGRGARDQQDGRKALVGGKGAAGGRGDGLEERAEIAFFRVAATDVRA